jgi:hypothetical protein
VVLRLTLTHSSAVLPFAEAFTAPNALSENLPPPGIQLRLTDTNDLTPLELQLQEELRVLGRQDMALAVGNSRKYQRVDLALYGSDVTYEFAVGVLRSFNPTATVPPSKEQWINEGMLKFGQEEHLEHLITQWEAFRGSKAETTGPLSCEPVSSS